MVYQPGIKEAIWEKIEQPPLNKKGEDYGSIYLTPETRHFMVLLVTSHMTCPWLNA